MCVPTSLYRTLTWVVLAEGDVCFDVTVCHSCRRLSQYNHSCCLILREMGEEGKNRQRNLPQSALSHANAQESGAIKVVVAGHQDSPLLPILSYAITKDAEGTTNSFIAGGYGPSS